MHAQTAAFRSADLSRQVGAVITARDGHLLTTGCNEVPRPGGGEYWEDDLDDDRDFQVGYDFNDRKKRETEIEFLSQIDGIIIPSMLAKGVKSVYEDLESLGTFRGTRVDSLIEFGRAMHAEMAALTAASASAVSVKDADLYCTTFPCHMCTRLIISAGLRNVYYIEPYPKSAAIEMYGEHEIVVNPNMSSLEHRERRTSLQRDDKRVHFIAFEGVAPRRYGDLFNNAGKDRKNKRTGEVVNFHPLEAKPRHAPFVPVHTSAETKVRDSVQAQEAQLEQKPERDPQNQRNVPEVIRSGEIP
jgi:cytidine deaminase